METIEASLLEEEQLEEENKNLSPLIEVIESTSYATENPAGTLFFTQPTQNIVLQFII